MTDSAKGKIVAEFSLGEAPVLPKTRESAVIQIRLPRFLTQLRLAE